VNLAIDGASVLTEFVGDVLDAQDLGAFSRVS
jgi:hypothetical protein